MDYKQTLSQFLSGFGLEIDETKGLIADADIQMGDYALPCFKLAAKNKQNPRDFAAALAQNISEQKPDWLDKVEAVNGYINFRLNRERYTAAVLSEVMQKGKDWQSAPKNGKTITIDYSSINIAKDFHIGHLLTTVIGGSLYKIFEFLGYNVVGINHIGDWGTQFGKLICACKKWGAETDGFDTMEKLTKLYVKFHQESETDEKLNDEARAWFKKIEDDDAEALGLFKQFKEITLKEVNKVYELLGVKFDSYDGESFFNDKMQPVIDILKKKKLLKMSDGAQVVDLDAYGMPPCLILKSDGATLYATRDLAAALYRQNKYKFDQNLYVVAYQQNLHFKQVFKVLELMEFDWAKGCKHIPFGMVSLESGAMSTRKGNVILLKDVLSTAIEKTREIIETKNPDMPDKDKTAADVGVGAVIFFALFNSRIKDMVFSFDKALNFEGETGPYLQYTHARCCSVLNKAASEEKNTEKNTDQKTDDNLKNENSISNADNNSSFVIRHSSLDLSIDSSLLSDDSSYAVTRLLGRFDAVINDAADKYEPSVISRYLIDLAQSYNKFYLDNRILNAEPPARAARLLLTQCVRDTLQNGLRLLLIKAPEKM